MLFPRHPKPVGDHRPVAVQIIRQERAGAVNKHVLVIDRPAPPPSPAPVPAVAPTPDGPAS
ncbi:hypothetical protein ASF61_19200 [Duganella sp. Leaf126]|uniref:hypothetical protein n=1 Tax=Duganella sp. Leaf126 TaxID=1736266 RepID=UPI0006F90584|nr:hypothetical protein [Duganella sp. Leaf126]KQQ45786.1 hypothetical protein ASF61_19200 [Duganella sp. Leaf126]